MKTKQNSYDLSLIICCYNEAQILESNIDRLISYLNHVHLRYELIFVEDCSQDETRKIIKRIVRKYPGTSIKTIFHSRNTGRGSAVKDGLKVSEGTVAGYIDIDLEVDESHILPCVISILKNGYDVVTGYRIYKIDFKPPGIFRHLISLGYRKLLRLFMKTTLLDTETGYKFFRLEKILPLLQLSYSDHWFWDTEIMLLAETSGLKIKEIPCLYLRNTTKRSTVKPIRDSFHQLAELIRFKAKMKYQKNRV